MRIALVTDAFYPTVNGTTTTVKAMADRLIDTGHDLAIVAPAPGLRSYRRAPVVRISPLSKPGAQVRDALALFAPDIVHVTDPGRVGRRALLHARRLGLRTVAVQHSPVPTTQADLWRRRVAEQADTLLVTARWMRAGLARLGVPAGLWLPGVDPACFTPALRDPWLHDRWARARSRRGPQVVVGYAGGLRRQHGVRRLAELARVPGIRPVVIGEGPQRTWLESRLPEARFLGPLGTGDLAVALASLDVLVHTGEHETCCHVLREAAASGVPVVAPRSGGARDVVSHLESGLLYHPGASDGLISAVTSVAADAQRHLLGARGRALALERTWADAVDELSRGHHTSLFARPF
ncbi:glycosyltransferase [Nocardioides insulae]|uniref:glycosyltransferase n=1 Tax=Nocardioides insulae TaxID=394734 RepID=UPI00042230D8|nr:glycosyltransferase [Nocardioides insulae]